jgi:short-subunit dehydrogenase
MAIKLKKLKDQVIVITGASSGIGLCTAQSAAIQGAKVVLAARSGETLDDVVQRITANGGEAVAVVCDVADRAQVDNLAAEAIARFGRFDTWVNNAGVAIYGKLEEVNLDDARRMFDINFWGVVHGSRAALPHLRGQGGALINVGSEVSEAYVPILGYYAASKHAVKGFTDALRVEVEYVDKAPVSVTLIQPTAVDTPFDEHARNYMEREAKLPSNMIDPQDVADAILKSAVKPKRWVKVGSAAKINAFAAKNFPGVADRMTARQVEDLKRDEPPRDPAGTLHAPSEDGRVHGDHGDA